MSKLTKDHPAFARVGAFIDAQVLKCRPSAIKIATRRVLSRGFGLTTTNVPEQIAIEVDVLETKMYKRLARYYGLAGKYVAH